MSRKKDANKYWIYGEDAALAAQFTAYLATVLKNRRLTYIRHLKKIQKVECSYEYAAETIEHVDSIREECDNRQRGVKSAYPLSYRCHHYRQIVGKEQRNENESYRLSYAKTRILLCRSESAHR